jgi:putative transposase
VRFGLLIKSYLEIYSAKTDVEIEIAEVDKDHIHILLCLNSLNFNVEKWIIGFKQFTTHQLYYRSDPNVVKYLKQHFWYKNTFWSDGAFVTSIGNVSAETAKEYIENQG